MSAFVGYKLKAIEEAIRGMADIQQWSVRTIQRIDRKVDALSQEMTPAERMALVEKINAETAEVNRVATEIHKVATDMNQTAKS